MALILFLEASHDKLLRLQDLFGVFEFFAVLVQVNVELADFLLDFSVDDLELARSLFFAESDRLNAILHVLQFILELRLQPFLLLRQLVKLLVLNLGK